MRFGLQMGWLVSLLGQGASGTFLGMMGRRCLFSVLALLAFSSALSAQKNYTVDGFDMIFSERAIFDRKSRWRPSLYNSTLAANDKGFFINYEGRTYHLPVGHSLLKDSAKSTDLKKLPYYYKNRELRQPLRISKNNLDYLYQMVVSDDLVVFQKYDYRRFDSKPVKGEGIFVFDGKKTRQLVDYEKSKALLDLRLINVAKSGNQLFLVSRDIHEFRKNKQYFYYSVNVDTGKIIGPVPFKLPERPVYSHLKTIHFVSESQLIYVGNQEASDTDRLYDVNLKTSESKVLLETEGEIRDLKLFDEDRKAFVDVVKKNGEIKSFVEFDLKTRKKMRTIKSPNETLRLAAIHPSQKSPDKAYVVTREQNLVVEKGAFAIRVGIHALDREQGKFTLLADSNKISNSIPPNTTVMDSGSIYVLGYEPAVKGPYHLAIFRFDLTK